MQRDSSTGGKVAFFRLDRRSEQGDPHGLALAVRIDRSGRVWSESASTHNLADRTSWLRRPDGIGIGSTVADLHRAFPQIKCGGVSANSCTLVRSTGPSARWTGFFFDRSTRSSSARVRALLVECLGGTCKAAHKRGR